MKMRMKLLLSIWTSVTTCWLAQSVLAQGSFEQEPINYSSAPVSDPISRLQQQIDDGTVAMTFDSDFGYLKSVLQALNILPDSQMLVFSKTSFQLRRITPWTPRALYFNDDVYIGWVPQGDVIEVSSVDPQLGAVFYTLEQTQADRPVFVRDQGNCLTCHASSRTQNVPGHLVRSVYPSADGQPHFGAGTFRTNHASPFAQRWGGWYVTGTHGKQRHMGNVIARDKNEPGKLDIESGANVTDLSPLTRTDLYLTGHSDIVALLVLEHQTDMHNYITFANHETRAALHHGIVMNRALERPDDFISESTARRLDNAAEKLVKYMLFADEVLLTDKIVGSSEFTQTFGARGPRDAHGRSLRDFDLERRLFKYPCSYLIYSEAFDALPAKVKERVYRRLWEVLTEQVEDTTFANLSSRDRRAIYEILLDTKDDLPTYWTSS